MAIYYKDKWWGKYLEDYDYDDGAHLRSTGLPVWVLIGNYRLYEGDKEKAVGGYSGYLTMEDMEAALAYYNESPYEVDKKLWENEHDYPYIPELLDLVRQMESVRRQLAVLRRRSGYRRERVAPYAHRRRRPR